MCSAFPTLATILGASRLRSYTLCRTTRIVSMVWAASAAGQTARSVGTRRRARASRARITRFCEEAMPRIYSVAILLSMRAPRPILVIPGLRGDLSSLWAQALVGSRGLRVADLATPLTAGERDALRLFTCR